MVGQNILLTVSNLPIKIPVNSVTFGIADGQSATWRVSNNQGREVVILEFFHNKLLMNSFDWMRKKSVVERI